MIIDGLAHRDAVVRMRSADVAEKVSRQQPLLLAPHKETLLDLLKTATEQELRWHLAQMLPRLELNAGERAAVRPILKAYLNDRSRIVQTFALQALFDLSVEEPSQRRAVLNLVDDLLRNGSPAVRARARKLKAALSRS